MPRRFEDRTRALVAEARRVAASLLLHLGHSGEEINRDDNIAGLTVPEEFADPLLDRGTVRIEIPSRKLTIEVHLDRLVGSVLFSDGLPLQLHTGNYKVMGLNWHYFGQAASAIPGAELRALHLKHPWGGTPEVPDPERMELYRSTFYLVYRPATAEIVIRHCSESLSKDEIELARFPYATFSEKERQRAGLLARMTAEHYRALLKDGRLPGLPQRVAA